jgi:NTE family protein
MRSLVLSGGSVKSAYSCGVLRYLLGDLKNQYSTIVGVSSGALCAGFLGMYPLGQEELASKHMADMWMSLDNDKIYTRWSPWGRLHVLWKLGFFDNTPMKNLVRNTVKLDRIRQSGKTIVVGAVSLTSGKYTEFDQTSDDFIDYLIASSSFPVMFEPVKIGEELWSDGGLKTISPTNTAILSGADEIDVITTSPILRDKKWIKNPSIIDIIERSFDLFTEKILTNDIERALMYNKLAAAGLTDKKQVKINIIRPDHNLVEDLLDFSPDKIKYMIELGYSDAKRKYAT